DDHVRVVEEGDEHPLAVGRGGGAGPAIKFVDRLRLRPGDSLLPENAAVLAGETEEQPVFGLVRVAVLDRRRDKYAIAPDDRGRVPVARDGRFPDDVVRGRPLGGEALLVSRAVPAGAAPHGPVAVGGEERGSEEEEGGKESGHEARGEDGGN